MPETTSTSDLAALTIGVMGVISTLVITLIGIFIAYKFDKSTKKIDLLESEIHKYKDNLFGIRVFSSVMFESLNNMQSVLEIQRRSTEDILKILGDKQLIDLNYRNNFIKSIKIPIEEFARLSYYFQIINAKNIDRDTLLPLVLHFPDFKTHYFLSALAKTIDGASEIVVRDESEKLEWHLKNLTRNGY